MCCCGQIERGIVMRVRSTGLGKDEMVAKFKEFKILDGHLIMVMESTAPVRWHIRIALNYRDMFSMLRVGFFSILVYLVVGLGSLFRKIPPPVEY